MKNLFYGCVFILMFSCASKSTHNYIESKEAYFTYLETLKPWADSVQQLNGGPYAHAMSDQLCDCLTKVNFGLVENIAQLQKGITSKDSTKYSATLLITNLARNMVVSRPIKNWNTKSEIEQIREYAEQKCPTNFIKMDSFNKMEMQSIINSF